MKLARGHHLVEFARRGEWVHVGVSQSGGLDGWIHESLVDTVLRGSTAAKPAKGSPNFEAFRKDMAKLNEQARRTASFPFFTKIEDMGDSIIRLTAHDGWLEAPRADREKNLNVILELWAAHEGTGLPVAVNIVDRRGKLVMSKSQ